MTDQITKQPEDSVESMAGSVDVTLVLSCGTSECPNHGSHNPNIGGSMACMKMVGRCAKWTKPNDGISGR